MMTEADNGVFLNRSISGDDVPEDEKICIGNYVAADEYLRVFSGRYFPYWKNYDFCIRDVRTDEVSVFNLAAGDTIIFDGVFIASPYRCDKEPSETVKMVMKSEWLRVVG